MGNRIKNLIRSLQIQSHAMRTRQRSPHIPSNDEQNLVRISRPRGSGLPRRHADILGK